MEAINAALRKIKYRGEQTLTQYLLTEEDMTRFSTVNRFLTKLEIFSTTLLGDQYVTSSVLLPVIAAQAQAPRQSVCSAEWVSCRTRGGSACLVHESVTMQLFLNDNLELWVDVCLIPRWDDNKLWYPHIASKLICFPGDIFVLIGFVIIGG